MTSFGSRITLPDIATPSTNPPAGRRYLYSKSGQLYMKDSAGVETSVGTGGGAAAVETQPGVVTARVATTSFLNVAATQSTVDGVALANGDVVLYASADANSGLYKSGGPGTVLTRVTGYTTTASLTNLRVRVTEGTYAGHVFRSTWRAGDTLGTTVRGFDPVYEDASVRVATTQNVDLAAAPNNGVVYGLAIGTDANLSDGQVVLVRAQTAPAENGVYVYRFSAGLTRHPLYQTAASMAGVRFSVRDGYVFAGRTFVGNFKASAVVGTDPLYFQATTTRYAPRSVTVRAAGSSLSLSTAPGAVVDGVTLALGDLVLMVSHANAYMTGIYVINSTGMARHPEYSTAANLAGLEVAVLEGTSNGGKRFKTSFKATDTVDTTAMTWAEISTAGHTHGIADLAVTGTPSVSTFLRGDGSWAATQPAAVHANPSFEGAFTNQTNVQGVVVTRPADWDAYWTGTQITTSVSTTNKTDGTQAWRFDRASGVEDYRIHTAAAYAVAPGDRVKVWIDAMSGSAAGHKINLGIVSAPTAAGATLFGTGSTVQDVEFTLTDTFTRYEATLIIPPGHLYFRPQFLLSRATSGAGIWIVDNSGSQITAGSQVIPEVPAIGVYKTTATTLASSTNTVLDFDTIRFDATGGMKLENGSIRVPRSGWYQVNATVSFASSTASARRIVFVGIGDDADNYTSVVASNSLASAQDTAAVTSLPVSALVYVAADKFIHVVAQSVGATWALEVSQPYHTALSVVWVGESPTGPTQLSEQGASIMPYAYYDNSGHGSMASGTTWTQVTVGWTEVALRGVEYQGNGSWRIVEAGRYNLAAFSSFAASATGNRGASIYVNGVARATEIYTGIATNSAGVHLETEEILAVGDLIDLRVFQNSGVALNHNGGRLRIRRVDTTLVAAGAIPATIQATAVSDVPLSLQGASGQTGDLQQWKDSTGAVLAQVTGAGQVMEGGRRLAKLTSRLTAAATSTSTTYAGTGLSVTLTAGRVYKFRARGQYRTAATTTGIGLRVGGTATATGIRYETLVYGLTATTYTLQAQSAMGAAAAATTGVAAANTDYKWEIEGLIRVNAGGTLTIDFISEVAASTVTIQPDCLLEAQEVA